MVQEKPTIKIPDKGGVKIKPGGKIDNFKATIAKRFDKIDALLFAIVTSVIISTITGLIAVFAIFIEQFHFNNAAYKDYAQKLEERNQILNDYKQQLIINEQLLQQIATKSGEKQ